MKSVLKAMALPFALTMAASGATAGNIAVGKVVEINVDPSKLAEEKAALWTKFGGWCSIQEWHPAIAKCEESKDGDDTFRTLTLKDGAKIKEKLLESTDQRYRYAIIESPLPVKDYEAQFTLTPDDDDEDEINFAWSAVFKAEGKPDKEVRDIISGIFQDGLDSIKKLANPEGSADKNGDDKEDDDDKGKDED